LLKDIPSLQLCEGVQIERASALAEDAFAGQSVGKLPVLGSGNDFGIKRIMLRLRAPEQQDKAHRQSPSAGIADNDCLPGFRALFA
jgi:hypothetical protein